MLDNKSKAEDYTDLDIGYDEDTGFPDPEAMHVDDIAATQDLISTAGHLEEMEATTGWALLLAFLGEEVNSVLGKLRTAKDIDEVRRLQALVEALELFPKIVENLKSKAVQASQVLAEYTISATQG